MRRGVRPAAAPVHADGEFHIHSVLRNPIISDGGQPGGCIIKNCLLNGIKAKRFHKVISGLAEGKAALLHVLRHSVKDADFQRKIRMFRILHEQRKNFPINAMGSEGFQRFLIVDSSFQLPQKTARQNPVFQFPLPGSGRQHIRPVEAGLQAQSFRSAPGIPFLLRCFSPNHFPDQQRELNRFLHAGSSRIQTGAPEGMLLSLRPEF